MFNFAQSQSPLDMFYHWEAKKPDEVYLRQPVDQEWRDYTWGEVGDQARDGGDEITTIYTSGLTGLPKGVVYSHAATHLVRGAGYAIVRTLRSIGNSLRHL